MSSPVYGTDLTTITTAGTATGWAELNDSNWAKGGGPAAETDYFIQGSQCVSATMSKAAKGSMVYTNSSDVTIPSPGAVLVWQYFGAPNALETLANGGQMIVISDSTSVGGANDFNYWYVGGSDYPPNPYGGWKNSAVDPTVTPDGTVGSPTTSRHTFGSAITTITGVFKGNPFATDAIRFGRCEAKFTGGGPTSSCTFDGFATQNDNGDNRWGLIQAISGGYLWKGKINIGSSAAADFRDSNVNVFVDDTRKVTTGFNKVEIRSTSTYVEWNGVNFAALGTKSPGQLEIVTSSADVNFSKCQFTDFGWLTFRGNSASTDCVFRRCEVLTQNGAVFNRCTFDSPSTTIGLKANNPANITDCIFIAKPSSGHAIEITATGTYAFSGNTFTGYGANETPSAAIYNRSGGSVTLNLSLGDQTPTVRNSTSSDTTILNTVTVKVTAKDVDTLQPVTGARVLLKASTGGSLPADVPVSVARTSTTVATATVTHTGHGLQTGDKVSIEGADQPEYTGIFSITWASTSTYTYPIQGDPTTTATGSITSTYVILDGLTSDGGFVQDTGFNYASSQPVIGKVRKGTTSPRYKTAPISGTITSNGFDVTSYLIPDE